MKTKLLTGLIIFFPFLALSQGENNNWFFTEAAVTFNSGSPVLINPSPAIGGPSVTACVSDSSGNLLFYSDGGRVYNRYYHVMPNGYVTDTGVGVQSVLAIKKPHADSIYYLFTVHGDPVVFVYSVIDMRLDSTRGDIVSGMKNLLMPDGTEAYEGIHATRHQNNKDTWVVTRKSGKYGSYLIDTSGIHNPVLSNSTLLPHTGQQDGAYIKVSRDGTKMIASVNSRIQLEYCNFDKSTGVVTPLFTFEPNLGIANQFVPIGLEFSRSTKYVYVATYNTVPPVTTNSWELFQYDATKTDSAAFMQSQVLIDTLGVIYSITGLQLAPDDKIYGPIHMDYYLCVINNPDSQGIACNFQLAAVPLSPYECNEYLPQVVQKYFVYIRHTGVCDDASIQFSGSIWPPADSIHWDFGDPGSGSLNFSNLLNPSHVYSNTGSYTVELFVRHNDNRTDTAWQTITIIANPQVDLGADRTICIGDSTTFDAGACSGCTYQWKNLGTDLIVGTGQTYKTGLADSYSVIVTNSNNCSASDTVQLTTTPVPSVTNNPLSKSICSGDSTHIILTSSVTGTIFHWTASLTSGNITGFSADSGLVINQLLINSLSTPGIVTYHITPKVGSCAGNTVDFPVTVTPGDSVKVTITASANNICAGTTVTFTATPTNPGTTPVYQWKVNSINAGTNSTTFTYTPVNGDIVTCVLTSSITACISNNPATSNGITMVVNPNLPVSVTVTASQNPVCAGNSVTFTATPINGGLSPIYQWKVNGSNAGTNSPIYSYIPNNGDILTCVLTSNAVCPTGNPATSNAITMTVNPNLAVSISIVASANPFCQGSSVTFTATPVNGGGTPGYQWQVNAVNVGTNNPSYTYNPLNGDLVTCILTSSIACPLGSPATSNIITMSVNSNLPAGVTIVASSNPFCPGSSVIFTATPINGGTTPAYQWKVNGVNAGTNSHIFTYNPANGDSIRCVMTSNLSCVTGNPASSAEIIMSGTLAPIVTFTSCFDTITTVNAKPIKLKGGIPLGGTYSGPGVNSLTGTFTPSVAGTGTKTITYTYTNAAMCSASKSIHIIVQAAPAFTCGNNVTDIRDNKVYPTVQIGSQCWLAANLNFGTIIASTQDQRDNCISEKYCYNDNPVNCTNQGGLYQWDELMQYDDTPGDQGFCPPAWHIPTENDWNTLFANYVSNAFAASPLKYSGYSGFNALLCGARHIDKSWDFQGFATFFWSSSSYGGDKAWAHGMNDVDPSVSIYPASRANAFSVRCLKD
jgi:uncharacterized protein (TIGR02145 family)